MATTNHPSQPVTGTVALGTDIALMQALLQRLPVRPLSLCSLLLLTYPSPASVLLNQLHDVVEEYRYVSKSITRLLQEG
jgi:hypothetical protein